MVDSTDSNPESGRRGEEAPGDRLPSREALLAEVRALRAEVARYERRLQQARRTPAPSPAPLPAQGEATFQLLAENLQDLVCLHHPDGRFGYVGPSVRALLGYAPADLLQQPPDALLHPEDRPRWQAEILGAVAAGRSAAGVLLRLRTAAGSYRWFEVYAKPVLDGTGRLVQIVTAARDVTERRQVEAELRAARDRAEEMARLKSTFLANMSHEIRTPLTAIIGFAEVLASELPEEYREFAHLIGKSGKRLMDTLNSVLNLAQLESDTLVLHCEPLDVVEVVRDVHLMLEPTALEKGLSLTMSSAHDHLEAHLDAACLHRILVNLVSNAIKFTERGDVSVEVETTAEAVVLRVRDTGRGIDPSFLPHLFSAFRQESTGVARSHEGSGLGLYITRRLTELMGGTIEAASVKGQGSVFTVTLPRQGPCAGAEAAPTARPHLLIVEDNPDTLALLRHLLQENYDLCMVSTVDEALQAVQAHPFALALIDIHLGPSQAQTGIDLCRALRERPGRPRLVAMTAYALPGDRERLLAAGFDAYLGKPFTRDQLFDLLTRLLPA